MKSELFRRSLIDFYEKRIDLAPFLFKKSKKPRKKLIKGNIGLFLSCLREKH